MLDKYTEQLLAEIKANNNAAEDLRAAVSEYLEIVGRHAEMRNALEYLREECSEVIGQGALEAIAMGVDALEEAEMAACDRVRRVGGLE